MRRFALILAAALLAGSCSGPSVPPPENALCAAGATPITAVQGNGYRSPMVGQRVTVRGVVTRIEPDRGYYIEQASATGEPGFSRALFVQAPSVPPQLRRGLELGVEGLVEETGRERDTLTGLVDTGAPVVCGEGLDLPLTATALPLDSPAREALEGMRVTLPAALTLTDTYNMHRGEWVVSAGGALRLATEDSEPGRAAGRQERQNRQRSLSVTLPPGPPAALPVGTELGGLTGVLGHGGARQSLYAEAVPSIRRPDLPAIEPPADGHLRIVSLNLLNFWNGDGRGGGFPTERGARSPQEFAAQKDRTRAALSRMQPHLLAVQELENDGFGPHSAAQSLLDVLNGTGHDDWRAVDPGGRIGGDVITVGLFYRAGLLEPMGAPRVLQGAAFERLSRQPLAQRFRARSSGQAFWAVVNHLKSKGSCPESGADADRDDGQGCWNAARVRAVEALAPWLDELAAATGTTRVIVLGDMNSWRREDPIRAFRAAGWHELVEELSGLPQHSFLYFGQRGTLDYAFASPQMRREARRAFIWHINADWPRDMDQPAPWLRVSDHDPVVVDVSFSQSATSD